VQSNKFDYFLTLADKQVANIVSLREWN